MSPNISSRILIGPNFTSQKVNINGRDIHSFTIHHGDWSKMFIDRNRHFKFRVYVTYCMMLLNLFQCIQLVDDDEVDENDIIQYDMI